MLFHGSEIVSKKYRSEMDISDSQVVKKRRKVVDENFCEVIEEKEVDRVSIEKI